MTDHRISALKAMLVCAGLACLAGFTVSAANAGNIIDDWASVKAASGPSAQAGDGRPVDDGVIDARFPEFQLQQRAAATLCAVVAGHEEASRRGPHRRRDGGLFHHQQRQAERYPGGGAPIKGEPIVQASVDKFDGTDLAKILSDKGIKTVITVGTAAQGAILYTASAAALRGLKVIVPVDGVSAEDTYFEQYVVYDLSKAPGVSKNVTLTSTDMMKF